MGARERGEVFRANHMTYLFITPEKASCSPTTVDISLLCGSRTSIARLSSVETHVVEALNKATHCVHLGRATVQSNVGLPRTGFVHR